MLLGLPAAALYNRTFEMKTDIKTAVYAVLLCVLLPLTAQAGDRPDKAACERVKIQIRAIEAKMRNGYSAAQGIRYDERLRQLKAKRYRLCR